MAPRWADTQPQARQRYRPDAQTNGHASPTGCCSVLCLTASAALASRFRCWARAAAVLPVSNSKGLFRRKNIEKKIRLHSIFNLKQAPKRVRHHGIGTDMIQRVSALAGAPNDHYRNPTAIQRTICTASTGSAPCRRCHGNGTRYGMAWKDEEHAVSL